MWSGGDRIAEGLVEGGAFVADSGLIYLIGGVSGTSELRTVQSFDPATGIWTNRAPMPTRVTDAAGCYLDGMYHLFGGTGSGGITSSLQVYDIASDTWSMGPEVPFKDSEYAAVGFEGTVYLYGTVHNSGYKYVAGAWAFDPTQGTYAPIPLPRSSSRWSVGAQYDGSIYLVGGYVYPPATSGPTDRIESLAVQRQATYTSSVFDAGEDVGWGRIGWSGYLPSGSDISLRTRSSIDGATWSDWTAPYATGDEVSSVQGRYLQYQAQLQSSDLSGIPVLGDIAIGVKRPSVPAMSVPVPLAPVDTSTGSMPTLSWLNANGGLCGATFRPDDLFGGMLDFIGSAYFGLLASTEPMTARAAGVASFRGMSVAMTGFGLSAIGVLGVRTGVSADGYFIDVDRDESHAVAATAEGDLRAFALMTATTGSVLEHRIWELMFPATTGSAVSAVKVLTVAAEQSIPIHHVDGFNLSDKLAVLDVPDNVEADIASAVSRGAEVLVPETLVNIGDWSGTGFVVEDPTANSVGCMLISGTGGGLLDFVTDPDVVPNEKVLMSMALAGIMMLENAGVVGISSFLSDSVRMLPYLGGAVSMGLAMYRIAYSDLSAEDKAKFIAGVVVAGEAFVAAARFLQTKEQPFYGFFLSTMVTYSWSYVFPAVLRAAEG